MSTQPVRFVVLYYYNEYQGEVQVDHFHEEIIVSRNNNLREALYWILNILMVILGLGAAALLSRILSESFTWLVGGGFLVLGGLTVLILLTKGRLRVEYEYSFTNGDLDVDRVVNNNQRKRLLSLNVRKVEKMGRVPSPQFDRLSEHRDAILVNAFCNKKADLCYMFIAQENGRYILVFEPSQVMRQLIRQYNPLAAVFADTGEDQHG